MEFLTKNAQGGDVSYPLIFFFIIGLIGFLLVFIKPYNAFLFSIFCLSARNFHAAVHTRSPITGVFLNLNDLLLWIAFFSMLMLYWQKRKKIWIPGILAAIFGIIIIGDIQSILRYGTAHQVLRRIWSTAIFPIMFLVGANMVQNEKKAGYLYKALFLGAMLAAMQHCFYVLYKIKEIGEYALYSKYRIISYILSGGDYILIGAIFSNHIIDFKHYKKTIYYTGLTLIVLSILFNFTRGLWISLIGTSLILPYLIKKEIDISSTVKKIRVIFVFSIVIILSIFPNFRMHHKISQRLQTLTHDDTRIESYEGRKKAQIQEIKYWLESSIILGKGSAIPADLRHSEEREREKIAFYHVAYSTYLSHYGLTGLFIYLILLPFLTIKEARKYYLRNKKTNSGDLSLVVMALLLMSLIGAFSSMHFLGATCHIQGVLCGVMWGLVKGDKIKLHKNSAYSYIPTINNRE